MMMRIVVGLIPALGSTGATATADVQGCERSRAWPLGQRCQGNTTFYDAMGRNTGRSVTSRGTTRVYDQMGRQTGTIRSK